MWKRSYSWPWHPDDFLGCLLNFSLQSSFVRGDMWSFSSGGQCDQKTEHSGGALGPGKQPFHLPMPHLLTKPACLLEMGLTLSGPRDTSLQKTTWLNPILTQSGYHDP